MTRIAVFFDWQNVYKAAREAFGLQGLGNERGNFSPYQLARILAAGNDRGAEGELVRVEIHRGLPSSSRDPIGYGANRRQSAAWMAEDRSIVIPRLRPLRYPSPTEPVQYPVEKGIDVQMALGAVEQVLTNRCDVAIIFSHDTDLLPAVETICRLAGAARIETAAWSSHTFSRRLKQLPGVYHHSVSGAVFQRIETPVNYAYKGPVQ
jgi:uncharacterized LabA/DUF88 family protein